MLNATYRSMHVLPSRAYQSTNYRILGGGGIYSRTAAAMQKEDKIRKDDFASDVGSDTAGSETCGCIQMNTDHPI